eukprot:74898_1
MFAKCMMRRVTTYSNYQFVIYRYFTNTIPKQTNNFDSLSQLCDDHESKNEFNESLNLYKEYYNNWIAQNIEHSQHTNIDENIYQCLNKIIFLHNKDIESVYLWSKKGLDLSKESKEWNLNFKIKHWIVTSIICFTLDTGHEFVKNKYELDNEQVYDNGRSIFDQLSNDINIPQNIEKNDIFFLCWKLGSISIDVENEDICDENNTETEINEYIEMRLNRYGIGMYFLINSVNFLFNDFNEMTIVNKLNIYLRIYEILHDMIRYNNMMTKDKKFNTKQVESIINLTKYVRILIVNVECNTMLFEFYSLWTQKMDLMIEMSQQITNYGQAYYAYTNIRNILNKYGSFIDENDVQKYEKLIKNGLNGYENSESFQEKLEIDLKELRVKQLTNNEEIQSEVDIIIEYYLYLTMDIKCAEIYEKLIEYFDFYEYDNDMKVHSQYFLSKCYKSNDGMRYYETRDNILKQIDTILQTNSVSGLIYFCLIEIYEEMIIESDHTDNIAIVWELCSKLLIYYDLMLENAPKEGYRTWCMSCKRGAVQSMMDRNTFTFMEKQKLRLDIILLHSTYTSIFLE